MGLLKGERQKSANIVGQTMKLNPHGDAAIYETMVRLATGNEALLAPFVESKGNFGKYYSGDLSYAASRYTEAKLSPISAEIFKDIDKDPVDFVDSYDGAMKEPRLLPTTFPNILVSANKGIGVAMASDICGFNLNEVCTATMHYLKDPDCDLLEYMPMPDFSTGGEIIYRREEMEKIIETGLGSFQIRSRWRWIPEERIIEVYEIPYTTKTDVIIERIVKLSKEGKVREIADIRDETDLSGLRIAIDLKRGVDPDKLMAKLYRSTTLQDSFSCNFNVLVDGYPRVMGVREILKQWVAWRVDSTRRRLNYDLGKKSERLHLRVRGRAQAPQHQRGVHPQPHQGHRQARGGHRPDQRDAGQRDEDQAGHQRRARCGEQEVRHATSHGPHRPLRRRRGQPRARGRGVPGDDDALAGGLPQKDD